MIALNRSRFNFLKHIVNHHKVLRSLVCAAMAVTGGVEAYYKTPTGDILGIQAKYFFKLGNSEFGQIKKSLTTALKNHPTLSEYWIYIPFDLTGKAAEGKRGKSEVEKFEEWCGQTK